MTDHDDALYIVHILECIGKVESYAASGPLEYNSITYDAILRNLQTLSESTQRLSKTLKSKYSQIPWSKISAFRNILVHDYLGDLDIDLLKDIISIRLPELKNAPANRGT